ncbi:hypothetical protein CH340_25645, partial [Rhodoplanes serenus]
MDRVLAAIAAEEGPARKTQAAASLGARLVDFFAALSPRKIAWAGALAALVIVVQASVIAGLSLGERSGGGAPEMASYEEPAGS